MSRTLFRIIVVLAFAGFARTSALAGDPQKPASPLQEIYACAQISDNAKRLACYDAATGRLQEAEKAGEIVAVHTQALRSIRKEAFGFNLPSLPKLHLPFLSKSKKANALADADSKEGRIIKQKKSGEIANVEYQVDHIVSRPYGKHLFYLANGQVWEQTDSKHIVYPKHDKSLRVQIRKAAMGSYLLRINGKGRAIRVKRRE